MALSKIKANSVDTTSNVSIATLTSGNVTTTSGFSLNSTGTFIMPAASQVNDYGSVKKVNRAIPFLISPAWKWMKVGRVTLGSNPTGYAFGGGAHIKITGTQGFNARTEMCGYTEIHMYGSNNNSAGPNMNGRWYSINGTPVIQAVKAVSVNSTQYDNQYDIWIYGFFYSPNTGLEVTVQPGWDWTWADNYGTLTDSSPGSASNNIRDFAKHPPVYGARAYAKINGDTGAIVEAYGINSVTRNDSANFVIGFTEVTYNADYTIIGTASFDKGVTGDVSLTVNSDANNTGSTSGFLIRMNGAANWFFVAVFQNQ